MIFDLEEQVTMIELVRSAAEYRARQNYLTAEAVAAKVLNETLDRARDKFYRDYSDIQQRMNNLAVKGP
jgi:uncharacterized coiled-coil DUF342 family protein